MKHAYLIIAHNEFEVLQQLVNSLDDERNDIFIHFDKKIRTIPDIKSSKSGLFVLQNRVDVRWGSVRQIETEFCLFESALKEGPYEFYHLISGTHLPVMQLDKLFLFYEQHSGQELMRLYDYDAKDVSNKLSTYHLLMNWYNADSPIVRALIQRFWRYNLALQRAMGIKRNCGEKFLKADNWLSLTNEAVSFLVSNSRRILRKYRKTFCADEYFVPTELSACGERFSIYDCQNLLYVKFKGANAVILEPEDVAELSESDYLFARKFSASKPETLKLVKELK